MWWMLYKKINEFAATQKNLDRFFDLDDLWPPSLPKCVVVHSAVPRLG
jgi:hypothetical protein